MRNVELEIGAANGNFFEVVFDGEAFPLCVEVCTVLTV